MTYFAGLSARPTGAQRPEVGPTFGNILSNKKLASAESRREKQAQLATV